MRVRDRSLRDWLAEGPVRRGSLASEQQTSKGAWTWFNGWVLRPGWVGADGLEMGRAAFRWMR